MDSPAPPRQLPAGDTVLKSLGYLVPKAEGEAASAIPVFRITSEVLDRADDRIIGTGGKTENFTRNPVLLWNHDRWSPAIGTAKVYQDASGVWLMEPSFDGIGDMSKEISAKVTARTLRTCSIGFRILKHAYNDDGGLDVLEWELLEVSICNIPCNPEAERVKNLPPQQKNETPPTPPPEQAASKALEQADLDALGALMDAKLKPLVEAVAALTALMQADAATDVTETPPEAETTPAPAAEPKAAEPPMPEAPAKSFIERLARRS